MKRVRFEQHQQEPDEFDITTTKPKDYAKPQRKRTRVETKSGSDEWSVGYYTRASISERDTEYKGSFIPTARDPFGGEIFDDCLEEKDDEKVDIYKGCLGYTDVYHQHSIIHLTSTPWTRLSTGEPSLTPLKFLSKEELSGLTQSRDYETAEELVVHGLQTKIDKDSFEREIDNSNYLIYCNDILEEEEEMFAIHSIYSLAHVDFLVVFVFTKSGILEDHYYLKNNTNGKQ
jgi:hypothetical protein